MLPGKSYVPADVVRILRRRFWLVLVPVAVAGAAVSMWARQLPDLYYSDTTILVVPQRISEDVVRSTITSRIEDRLPAIRQEILSRPRLESLIREFELYPEERTRLVMEDVVNLMRDNIQTNIVRNDAFEVGFQGSDPVKVMRIADRLGSLFIQQSLSYRHNLAEDTDDFLESQLSQTRVQLEEQERRLENYKISHAGQLPSQSDSNLQQVMSSNSQVQAAQAAINRNMERRLFLERTIADLEKPVADATPPASSGGGDRPQLSGTTAQQLAQAQSAVSAYEARGLRPGHPDLEAARRQVRDLTQRLNVELKQASESDPGPSALPPAEVTRRERLADARRELVEIDRQIARSREDERVARANGLEAQARLDALPTRESELVALTRDYDILEESYRNLLSRREEAKISANLERQQVGEQFNILEPAQLPERPFSPDRMQLNLMGLGFGLAFGLGLVALLEIRDRTFKSDEDLAAVLGLPVLAVIPLMESEQDRRRAYWRKFGVSVGCGALVTCGAVLFVYAVLG